MLPLPRCSGVQLTQAIASGSLLWLRLAQKHGHAQSVGRQPVMKAFSHASDQFESLPGTANVCEPFLQPYTQSARREEQRL